MFRAKPSLGRRTLQYSAVVLVALAVAASSAAAQERRTVSVTGGSVSGVANDTLKSYAFRGIPFAAPPTGRNRWRPPQPVTPWSGVRDGAYFGHSCPQKESSRYTNISEDCLTLNVYTPLEQPTSPLPVMLFFYGGSYVSGSSSFGAYNGENVEFVSSGKVIFVTANYRLGALGYLGSAQLRALDTDRNTTGNYGLQDQRAAMAWVKENAAAFGGDPSSVMIFGESAGAGSTSAHLLAPSSWPYFQRAAMESGPVAPWISIPMDEASYAFSSIGSTLSCDGRSGADMVTCMQGAQWQDVIKAQEAGNYKWAPVVDGVELTDVPLELLNQGKWAKVPVLLGSNRDEGTLFDALPPNCTLGDVEGLLWTLLGKNATAVQEVVSAYDPTSYPAPWSFAAALIGDGSFTCPTRLSAKLFSKGDATHGVYRYFFTHVPSFAPPALGVFHSSEIPFVFGDSSYLRGDGEVALSDSFIGYWTSFAATGNPNHDGAVTWPDFRTAEQTLQLDLTIKAIDPFKTRECDAWDRVQP